MIIQKINGFVVRLEKGLLVVLLTTMLFLGLLQIISRFVIQKPISWSEAILTYMFVWSSYIAVSLGVHEKNHFSVDVIFRKLSTIPKFIISLICALLLTGFSIFLIRFGFYLVIFNKDQLMPALPFAMSWPYLALPVCGLFSLVHSLNEIWTIIQQRPKK